jgi:hypothetical protein
MSSILPSRRARFGTIRGSKDPLRSRGTSILTGPAMVATVLLVVPLRELPVPRPAGSPTSYPTWPVISTCSARSSTAFVIWFNKPPAPSSGVPEFSASFSNASIAAGDNASAIRFAAASSPARADMTCVTWCPFRPPTWQSILDHLGLTQLE